MFGNLSANCSYSQLTELIKIGQLKYWALALEKPSSDEAIVASLKGISKVLKKNQEHQGTAGSSALLLEFEIQGLTSALENLQKHDSDDIYEAVFSLLETYFEKEYLEDCDEESSDL